MARPSRLALLVLVALALVACGPPAAPDGSVTPEGPTRLPATATATHSPYPPIGVPLDEIDGAQVLVWHPWTGAEASLFQSQIEQFNRSNPWGITVAVEGFGDYTGLFEAAGPALQTDEHPDVIVALPEQILTWDAAGAVTDLWPYVYDPEYGLRPGDLADIPAVFWDQDLAGDRRVAVPMQRSAHVLYYNLTWAQELGFADAPTNADEFRAQACAANQSMRVDEDPSDDGQGGWLINTHPATVVSWMQSFGGGPVNGQGYDFLTYQNQETLKFLKDLEDKNCAWLLDPSVYTPYDAFAGRSALFVTGGLGELPDQQRAMDALGSTDEWTVIAFPGPERQAMMVYGSSLALTASTDQQRLAGWLFMRWMLELETQVRWVQSTGLLPLRTSSLDLLGDYALAHPQWRAAVDLIEFGTLQPQLASWRKVRPMTGDAITFMFRTDLPIGQVSVVLAQMDSTARELSGER